MTNGFKIFESDLRIEENFIVKFHQNSFPVKKSPNRLEWGFIGICTAGTVDIDVDFVHYPIEKGMIFSAFPGQVMDQQQVSDDFSLMYISCSPLMLQSVLFRFPPKFESFLKKTPAYQAPAKAYKDVIELVKLISSKCEEIDNICCSEVIVSMVRVYYLEIYNDIHQRMLKGFTEPSRKMEIMKKFIGLIMLYHSQFREVTFYAEKLNITPKYLSGVTRQLKGIGAKKFIDAYLISEIKLELKSTSKTIQEISDALNFPDPSFFSKYFKSHTGLTPKQFRGDSEK